MLYGSAVGVDFPNPFTANPIYEGQKSECGPGSSLLSLDVEVGLEREEGDGLGVVTVQFAGLRIAAEACEGEGEADPVEEDSPNEGESPDGSTEGPGEAGGGEEDTDTGTGED